MYVAKYKYLAVFNPRMPVLEDIITKPGFPTFDEIPVFDDDRCLMYLCGSMISGFSIIDGKMALIPCLHLLSMPRGKDGLMAYLTIDPGGFEFSLFDGRLEEHEQGEVHYLLVRNERPFLLPFTSKDHFPYKIVAPEVAFAIPSMQSDLFRLGGLYMIRDKLSEDQQKAAKEEYRELTENLFEYYSERVADFKEDLSGFGILTPSHVKKEHQDIPIVPLAVGINAWYEDEVVPGYSQYDPQDPFKRPEKISAFEAQRRLFWARYDEQPIWAQYQRSTDADEAYAAVWGEHGNAVSEWNRSRLERKGFDAFKTKVLAYTGLVVGMTGASYLAPELEAVRDGFSVFVLADLWTTAMNVGIALWNKTPVFMTGLVGTVRELFRKDNYYSGISRKLF